MARLLRFAILTALPFLALAAPASNGPRSLAKRTFKASAPGRHQLSALEDIARTKRKYDRFWEIVVIGSDDGTSSFAIPAAAATGAAQPTPLTPSDTATATSMSSSMSVAPSTYGNTTGAAPTSVPSSTPDSEDGSVAAVPNDSTDSEYLSPVTIGGQKFNLDFDTGSADLWVYDVSSVPAGRTSFDPEKSSSWKRLPDASWSLTYGDSSGAAGFVGTDIVDVGGSTVQKQAIEVAANFSDQFASDTELDGLLGLSFSTLNSVEPKQQLTFFDNVKADLTQPLFTADLEDNTGRGTYDFGTINPSKYSGNIHYTPVDDSQGWWQITTPQILIGEQTHDCSACSPAIVDTGTTLLYLDEDVVDAYYAQASFADFDSTNQVWTYPCSQKGNLPDLGIHIGDWVAHIDGPDLDYAPLYQHSNVTCIGGLQTSTQAGLAILGDVFIKQFFVVFDGGNMQVGVANKDI